LEVHGLQDALCDVPKDCGFIRDWLPQMELIKSHQKVVLLIGSCRKFVTIPMIDGDWETEKVMAAFRQQGYEVLLLDMRQTCRRHSGKGTNGCRQLTKKKRPY
jgi:hypothetical protein